MLKAIKIGAKDNVAVVLQSVSLGDQVQVVETGEVYQAAEFIKAGHKMALQAFSQGDTVIKYDIPIGKMKAACPVGGWIHCHNVEDTTAQLCSGYCEQYRQAAKEGKLRPKQSAPVKPSRTIMAYPRSNGQFGINNYIMVFPTCVGANAMAEALCGRCSAGWMVCDKEFLHDGRISEFTQMVISKTAQNPNIYAALIVGQPDEEEMNRRIADEIRANGTKAAYLEVEFGVSGIALEEGLGILKTWEQEAKALKRQPVSMEGFTMAVHCGGSDWTTALSGNPTLGVAADYIVEQGGFVVMDEWGGLPGSEHILAENAVTPEVGLELIDKVLLTRQRYIRDTGAPVEASNPIPENKEGGITTLVEKSTGNIKKAGSTGLQGVLPIATRPAAPGVYVQDQPCGGPSATAVYLAMAGCHLNVFVTGVGIMYYELPHMMTIRLTGNPETFRDHEQEYKLDFNAGVVIDGKPMQEAGKDLFEYIIAVAEGREIPKSEVDKLNYYCMYYYENGIEDTPYYYIQNYREQMKMQADRKKA